MVGYFRAITVASSLTAASAAAVYYSSTSTRASSFRFPAIFASCSPTALLCTSSSSSTPGSNRPPIASLAATRMDSSVATELNSSYQQGKDLLMTEFMVDMKCEGCVSAVKDNLLKLDGVKGVDVDLSNQVVRVIGSLPVKIMLNTLGESGRKARLIGQGSPDEFSISAAVAEFKGPTIFGVVRLAQINMELASIDANFGGFSQGKHGWSINEYGDLTKGAASTGKIYNPQGQISDKPLGDLGAIEATEKGEAYFSGAKDKLRVADLIGRSLVLYETEDKSGPGMVAAVIARSAGVGENYKKICSCDGVTIWEST